MTSTGAITPIIRVVDLHKHFGGVRAVDGVTLEIAEGSITGLIGPNGAGKTTLFNCMAGSCVPSAGRVLLEDEHITGLKPHALFAKGLLRTFQIAQVFPTLTVRENLTMVPAGQSGERLWKTWFARSAIRAEEARILAQAEDVIRFLDLERVAETRASDLSGGQKKLLELGRTMMAEPRIVFLDEVGAGVNRTLLGTIASAIERLNKERGLTFCLIEHDLDFVARLCDRVIVMAEGRVLTEGSIDEVTNNERVIEVYLGGGRAQVADPPMQGLTVTQAGRLAGESVKTVAEAAVAADFAWGSAP